MAGIIDSEFNAPNDQGPFIRAMKFKTKSCTTTTEVMIAPAAQTILKTYLPKELFGKEVIQKDMDTP